MPDAAVPVVEIADLSIRHGDVTAVDHVDLTLERGDVLGVLGPNGAGKTSLLEAVQGFNRPHTGRIRVFGMDPATEVSRLAHRWGIMPQVNGLPMGLTVSECVQLFKDLNGSEVVVDEILALTGLTDLARRKWRRLSGGEQQRVSLAVALCGGSELLMLDEPTAAVDDAGRERILTLISERAAAGSTIVLTSHRFDDVERVANRVVMIDHGRIVADDALDALTSDNAHIRFTATPGLDVAGLRRLVGPVTELRAGRFEVESEPTPSAVAAVVNWLAEQGVAPESVEAGRTSLEARYRALTGGQP